MLSLHGLETSDAGTDADAHTVGIFLLHVDAGHLESFLGGSYRKLGERLHSLGCLGIMYAFGSKFLTSAASFAL